MRGKYHYCHVETVKPDQHCVVKTLEVAIRPRMNGETALPYHSRVPEVMTVGIQRLVLIVPVEEVVQDK